KPPQPTATAERTSSGYSLPSGGRTSGNSALIYYPPAHAASFPPPTSRAPGPSADTTGQNQRAQPTSRFPDGQRPDLGYKAGNPTYRGCGAPCTAPRTYAQPRSSPGVYKIAATSHGSKP